MIDREPVHQAAPHTGEGERATIEPWQGEAQDDVAEWAQQHWGVIGHEEHQQ